MPDVLMPRLSDSMEEGTIVRWLKADGDEVARGEELAEIETDKATMSYEADDAGLLRIVAPEGATLPVGTLIATVGEPAGAAAATAAPEASASAAAAAPAPEASAGAVAATAAPQASAGAAAATAAGGASPVARRAAARLGVALDRVAGSGPRGRILKADVVAAARNGTAAVPSAGARNGALAAPAGDGVPPAAAASPGTASAAPAPAAAAGRGAVETVAPSRLQQTVVRRMAESKATVPDFVLEVEVDMTAALELRARLKQLLDPAPSLNDLLIKACAGVLRRHPRVNGAYRDGHFEQYGRVNVGIAVAAPDALVVPTIFDADQRSLGAIAAEARRLAERVRAGTITPPELSSGTFTVSNLGMFGVDRFAGVINPPQAAILCAGAIASRPAVADDGAIVARPRMSLTLVSDHRILYGADAARFLADLRAALEQPLAAIV